MIDIIQKLLMSVSIIVVMLALMAGNDSVAEVSVEPVAQVVKVVKHLKKPAKIHQEIKAQVVEVHDADTFFIPYSGSEYKVNKHGLLKIRLHLADAPEYDEHRAYFQQPYGKEAQIRVKKLLLGKEVTLKVGLKSYERPVCDVFVDGKSLAVILLREGLAWLDPRYIKTKNNLIKYQLNNNVLVTLSDIKEDDRVILEALNEARKYKRGIWSQREPIPPWEFRK